MVILVEWDMNVMERRVSFLTSMTSTRLPFVHGMSIGVELLSSAVSLSCDFGNNNEPFDSPQIFHFVEVSDACGHQRFSVGN